MDFTQIRRDLGFEKIAHEEEKKVIAQQLAGLVKNGDTIGFGSGSTSFLAAVAIIEKVQHEKWTVYAIPTSREMRSLCQWGSLNVIDLGVRKQTFSFDGADEVDPHGWLIKGRGGAMTIEKMIISDSPKAFILVDQSKFVSHLCEKHPIPVETLPEAERIVSAALYRLGASSVNVRKAGASKDGPVITEHGNLILDASFPEVTSDLEKAIKALPGVVESGLFIGFNNIQVVTNTL